MDIIKLRSVNKLIKLDSMYQKDAFLTATFTDITVLPFSGVIRYFGEFYKYDAAGVEIPGSMFEYELFNKREILEYSIVDGLFQMYPTDFTDLSFSVNLETFIKTAFIQKVAADGRFRLSAEQMEIV